MLGVTIFYAVKEWLFYTFFAYNNWNIICDKF